MIKYKTSKLIRFFTFGINRYGFKIDRGYLYKLGSFSKKINIAFIDSISFDQIYIQHAITYVYTLTNKKGQTYQLSYSLLDGKTYQQMFLEILRINENIKLDEKMKAFLESEITAKKLKFDFKVYEESYWKRDQELSQKHPVLDAIIGFTIVLFFLPIPFVFGIFGHEYLLEIYGVDYEVFRLLAVIASGIGVLILITNLFISLVSMYLGHTLTFVSLTIALLGLYFGFVY